MGTQSHSAASHVAGAVRATEAICSLQAIATHDWCDSAANALSAMFEGESVGLAILEADASGKVRNVESVGAKAEDPTGARAAAIRRRFQGAKALGWSLRDPHGKARAARLADLPGAAAWAGSDAGRLWQSAGAAEILVGVCPLHPSRPDRVVIVEVAREDPTNPYGREDALALEGVLGALARRAFVAFGPTPVSPARMLTGREQEVLSFLVLGMSVREIAERISRSPHTVHDYVKSLHRKLDATSRGALVSKALGHAPLTGGGAEGSEAQQEAGASEPRATPAIRHKPENGRGPSIGPAMGAGLRM